jgi:hypothetical protein
MGDKQLVIALYIYGTRQPSKAGRIGEFHCTAHSCQVQSTCVSAEAVASRRVTSAHAHWAPRRGAEGHPARSWRSKR